MGYFHPVRNRIASFFLLGKMEIIVNETELRVQVKPFMLKPRIILFSYIAEIHPREYRVIKEYSGWGIRIGLNSKAYNARGNEGVEIILKNGSGS